MIPLDQARALAVDSIEVGASIQLPLSAAHARFLAEPLRALRSLPNFDNSAMDGYALRSADTAGANRDRPARIEVIETIYAGAIPQRPLGEGQAARIFTGAPLPRGADCVVRQEATRAENDVVLVFVQQTPFNNVRRKGEELAEGSAVFAAGQKLDAYALGVLASLGFQSAAVWPPPTVAILTLGDELVAPGNPAQEHQTYDSNGALLAALSAEAGAEIATVEHAIDRESAVRGAIERLISSCDLLITSGGASVGDRDLVKLALRSLGAAIVFDGVAIKPGKPVGVSVLAGHPVAVLPGNPGAAAVAFDQLARPMLLKRQGVSETRQRIAVRLGSLQHKQGGLTYLLSAKLERDGAGKPTAKVRPQGSGQLLQNVGADGWVLLPPGRSDFAAGEEVTLELFSGAAFSAVGSSKGQAARAGA